ncbi:DUF2855 family protein [Ferrovibrio terrae]|uniref:DUF2855 family protein n=1 Tax=Ferrovibrio terrae TaxID=2594003 RepID=UPI003137DF78
MSQILAATAKSDLAATQFVVRKDDLTQIRFEDFTLHADDLQPEQILVKVDSFAFTANNITYAELGGKMSYWDFFPGSDEAWGIIPVWGFADVVASRHPAIAVDERIYGYFPMATHLVMQPVKLTDSGFIEGMPHRAKLPPAYNSYLRITTEPAFAETFQPYQALLRPLFITSFLIDDFLADENVFGAQTVVLSSASAKTAFGLAHLLHRRKDITLVGLTSAGNRAFVEGLGCYNRVVTYDQIAEQPMEDAVYVDFAGSADVRRAIHEHYGDSLKYSCAVGLSHREMNPPGKGLPGPKPLFFFAPDRIVKRSKDWGRSGLESKLNTAWADFLPLLQGWIRVIRGDGRAAVEATYRATLAGRVKADEGHILSLWE